MTILNVVIGIALLLVIGTYSAYALLAVRHATRFRYLSKRMLFLTLLFSAISVALIGCMIVSYGFFLLK